MAQRVESDVADVDAVDLDAARLRVSHPVQQRHRRALAGAGAADERHRSAGLDGKSELADRRQPALVGEGDMVELDVAARPVERDGVRLLLHRRFRIEHREELREAGHLEEQPGDEAHRLVEPSDQHRCEAHEGDDLTDGGLPAQVQPGAQKEDGDDGDRRRGVGEHAHHGPEIEHRILGDEDAAHRVRERAGFGRQPHVAVDERYVAERIAGARRQARVVFLHLPLRLLGARDDEHREYRENGDQADQQHTQAPIQGKRQRQQDEDGDERGEVLAEEGEPDAEQIVDPAQHDLQHAAGMRLAVERGRKAQHMFEKERHRRQPAAVREAIRVQRNEDGRDDAGEPDGTPDRQDSHAVRPRLGRRHARALRQHVDDTPEQHRLEISQ